MQALIDFIIRNLMQLWPIARVAQWETAMMVRNGKIRGTLVPGLHWRWLFIEEVHKAWCTQLNVDLPDAAITTKCGKSMIISANVGYKIVDLPKLWTTICNSNETIRNLAIGFLASECSEMTWDELQENRRELETRLTKHLHDELATCGLDINRVQLTDFVQTRMYRVFGNGTKVT